jgi:hypothetical protein
MQSEKDAEEKAGQLIAERINSGQRPAALDQLYAEVKAQTAPIGALSRAAFDRQWRDKAPPAMRRGGRRKISEVGDRNLRDFSGRNR